MKRVRKRIPDPKRYAPSVDQGLSASEVNDRVQGGWTNYVKKSTAKQTWRIFADNICTYFNLIWAVIIATLLLLREYDQFFFVVVIFANTAIAIFFELRAKYTLEKLNLLAVPQIKAIRGGETGLVSSDDLVLDDVILLAAGELVPADSVILDGIVEMNESMLTGESDAVKKTEGDRIYAGSYLISGACHARVDKVGADNYIQSMASQVKRFKAPQSYLFRDINRIIKYIGIAIIPFAALMLWNNISSTPDLHAAILKTTASVQGIIPAGMFLLITVAFSLGTVKLARKKAHVKDTYSIEMLSRTDTLCLDKTGTITDGTMRVVEQKDLSVMGGVDNATLIGAIIASQSASNFTSDALLRHYTGGVPYPVVHNIPFSSKRKFTATVFEGVGTCAIGAPEFLSVGTLAAPLDEEIKSYATRGQRVLMLAGSPNITEDDTLPAKMTPLALVVLEDHIREEAKDTIAWFTENNVRVKIISGDNPVTVAAIAARVGVEGADRYISLEGKTPEQAAEYAEDYNVFGRVTPDQKLALVRALRAHGHVVSMTGDGVNDTMALKEADCSIAMADGNEVAKSVSNIVLLNNNFAALPSVVREGRQVVNNVQRSATLFLMKTFFTVFFSLFCLFTMQTYPFEPNSVLMLEVFVTGLPSVILTLQPNTSRIEGRFISSVLARCLPDGMTLLVSVSAAMVISRHFLHLDPVLELSLLVLVLTLTAFGNLVFLCTPINRIRAGCVLFSAAGIAGTIFIAGSTFGVSAFDLTILLWLLILLGASFPIRLGMQLLYAAILRRVKRRKETKAQTA